MGKFMDLTGRRFGRLLVIEFVGKDKNRNTLWLCKCDCGKETIVVRNSLNSGHTKSCGCYLRESTKKRSTKHDLCYTRIYLIWKLMKRRCLYADCKEYKHYGGRGIKICDEWLDVASFYRWSISNGYREDLKLERIDNNGNYEPSNCRWATPKEQANNKRTNRVLTFNGKTQTIAQWADELHIKPSTLYNRIWLGWDIERTLIREARKFRG